MKICKLPLLFVCLILCSHAAAYAGDTTLSVPVVAQQYSEWCWVGTSNAVIQYYGNNHFQCYIANWAWGRNDCCSNTTFYWNHPCNQPNAMWGTNGSLQNILAHWNVASNQVMGNISKNSVVSDINAGKPFIMSWAWATGGGHFLVGYGYSQNGDYIDYMDPWPGHGDARSLYTWVVSAAGTADTVGHTWNATLEMASAPTQATAVPVFNNFGVLLLLICSAPVIVHYLRKRAMNKVDNR